MPTPKFSYIPKASGKEGLGRLAGSVFGGIADTSRALAGHALTRQLIWERAGANIVAHGAREALTTAELNTRGVAAREHNAGVLADELQHGKNITTAYKEGSFDPNVVLRSGKGTQLQARGQGFRPEKPEVTDENITTTTTTPKTEAPQESTPDVAGETSPSKPTPPKTTVGAPTPDLVQGTLPSATTTVADRASSNPVSYSTGISGPTKPPKIKMAAAVKPSKSTTSINKRMGN